MEAGSESWKDDSIVAIAARIIAAYVSNNSVASADLPAVINQVHASLQQLPSGVSQAAPAPVPLVPAVPIKKSVTPDFIICLEDGRQFKSLKRHLGSLYALTPDAYRKRWGLPDDYPMVAPNYASARSALAKQIGLGRKLASKAASKAK